MAVDSEQEQRAYQRMAMVQDAITLERAVRVIQRREPKATQGDPAVHAAVTWLGYYAQMLRGEAENGA